MENSMGGKPRRFVWLGLVLLLWAGGCTEELPTENLPEKLGAATPLGQDFEAANTGTIAGTVLWRGEMPQVPAFRGFTISSFQGVEDGSRLNPNRPRIDPATRGVAGAVVYLRRVDPQKSRPWGHGMARIEMRDREIAIRQGDVVSAVGWVRRGASVEAVNLDNCLHHLRGRGAAFFSLPFPDAHRPTTRQLEKKGVVELSSGGRFYWMRGYLFVDEHPYYTRTDAQGRFALEHVPAGTYELVCWLPSWIIAAQAREPEFGLTSQVDFAAPVERELTVLVGPGRTSAVEFTLSVGDFVR